MTNIRSTKHLLLRIVPAKNYTSPHAVTPPVNVPPALETVVEPMVDNSELVVPNKPEPVVPDNPLFGI